MVQFLLDRAGKKNGAAAALLVCALVLCSVAVAPAKVKEKPPLQAPPELKLAGGRRLVWERAFSAEREVKPNRGFWTRVVDVVAGEPAFHMMVRPYSVATDSRGRIIVADPGAGGAHIFDFEGQKYKFLSREDRDKDPMVAPQCVALDAQDLIYLTDSETGKIFVYSPEGKFQRTIGSLGGGEGRFKRPTGIAVDSAAQRIYVTDTLRHKIYVLDMNGDVLQTIGKRGSGEGEFNYPTELRLKGDELIVVDAMNFRVQVLGRDGGFKFAIGQLGDRNGSMFRPKGVATDSEGDIYVVDGLWGVVQVFDRQGNLLYHFGGRGVAAGQFQLPAGLFIDRKDRIYVTDSQNRRIQVYRFFARERQSSGGTP